MNSAQFINSIRSRVKVIFNSFRGYVNEAKESRRFSYEIIGWKENGDIASDQIIVQVIGTSTCIKITPLEIYKDDQWIKGFSPLAVKTISTLAVMIQNAPKYKLMLQDFRNSVEQEILVLRSEENNDFIRITATELMKHFNIIEKHSGARGDISAIYEAVRVEADCSLKIDAPF